jgi:hypothetical protein
MPPLTGLAAVMAKFYRQAAPLELGERAANPPKKMNRALCNISE